ncbi:MAG: serine/threonine-protein kinase [Polyangiales bacterium]
MDESATTPVAEDNTPSKSGSNTAAFGPADADGSTSTTNTGEVALSDDGPLALKIRDRIGQIVAGRYRIVELLGEGGMGAVYRGEHTTLHKRVAVKFLHPELSRSTEVVSRFQREAQAAAILDHPNVVAAHDFGRDEDGSFFLVMDFVDGATLGAVLEKEGRLSPARVLHIARHVGAALARAHEMGIVHRDLKPDNIVLVQREGDAEFAKVIDFGIAKVNQRMTNGQSLTQVGMVFGTPEYMAPEQALGAEVDNRADLYALSVLLFESITGRRPFDAEDVVSLLGMQMSAPVPKLLEMAPDLDVPAELDAFFAKALAKKPSERFATATELVAAFSQALGQTFTGLGPSATGRNSALSITGQHSTVGVPSAVTSQKIDAVPTPSGPISAVATPTSPPITSPPVVVPLSEIARQSLVVIPRAAATTLVSATRDGWQELAKDQKKKKTAIAAIAASVSLSLVFAIVATPSRPQPNATTIASAANNSNSARTTNNGEPNSNSGRIDTTHTNSTRPVAQPDTQRTQTQTPTQTPTTNVVQPLPTGPAPTGNLAADLAAFRAQPAIHVLLDPRGAMPLRARVDALEALRASGMDNPLMSYTLGTLYARQGRRGRSVMLDRFNAAVSARPEFAADETLLDAVIDAAEGPRGNETRRARDLLHGALRVHVAPRIIARLPTARTKKDRERDIALLSSDFATSIDATVLQIIEVFRARNCNQLRTAVDALAATGDARAVSTLESVPRPPRRCGWSVCNSCLGDSVDRAIAAVRTRPAPAAR